MQFLKVFCVAKNQMPLYICALQLKYVGVIIANQQFQGCCENECQKAKKVTTKNIKETLSCKIKNIYTVLIYKEVLNFLGFTLFSCLRTRLRNLSRTKDYQKENMNNKRLILAN